MKQKLTAVFQKSPQGYIGYVEALPGANTQGKTLEETKRNCNRSPRDSEIGDPELDSGKVQNDILGDRLLSCRILACRQDRLVSASLMALSTLLVNGYEKEKGNEATIRTKIE